jgi:lysyl-tRNA synthetase class 2
MAKASQSKQAIIYRHQVLHQLRDFFFKEGFLEVPTPTLLQANAPDPFVDPFILTSEQWDHKKLQLHTSPELWLKRALALGLPKVYELARVYRDERPGQNHLREFTMLEWYRQESDLKDLAQDCRSIFELVQSAWQKVQGVGEKPSSNYIELTVAQLFDVQAGIDLTQILERIRSGEEGALQSDLKAKGEYLPENASFFDAFFHVMVKYVEPNLPFDQVVFIYSWPTQLAALAATDPQNDLYCQRFEIYFRGLEIANAYQECNDPAVLKARFYADNCRRKSLGKPVFEVEEAFFSEIKDLGKVAGIALGLDRLMMAQAKKGQIGEITFGYLDIF